MTLNKQKGFLRLTIVLSIIAGLTMLTRFNAGLTNVPFGDLLFAFLYGFIPIWLIYLFIRYIVIGFIVNGFKK